ncbi:Hypothetical protein NTJ_00647 [Nesidiocoris tenuis]|uniref:MD-2-related lipid-recognition domain-containing protein n=1 Tax=Nesidiocoris tenuis TaxID=355587 RepID=A0ABN7AAD9_9HEMI|nr:Hypothetical protein NTJ_00647 [Nesidiocoris tenuis]
MELGRQNQGWTIIFILVCCMAMAQAKRTASTKKIVRIEAFENCQDRPNTPEFFKTRNYIDKVKLERVKMEQIINAEYIINKPVKRLTSEVEILKCETKDNSSCEYQMRYKLPDLCNLFLDKNQFYTPFIQSMSPTVKCPLNKPMYRIINGTFSGDSASSSMISLMPGSDNSYWAIKFSYKDDANLKEACCLYIIIKSYQLRMRQ